MKRYLKAPSVIEIKNNTDYITVIQSSEEMGLAYSGNKPLNKKIWK